MNIKRSIALAAALLAIGTFANAGEGDRGRHHGKPGDHHRQMAHMRNPERMVERMSEHLGLDETQTQELHNVVLAAKPQMDSLRERGRANRTALKEIDTDAPDYEQTIQALAAERGELATEMTLLRSQIRNDIHAKLTPEQIQQLDEAKAQMRQKFKDRRRRHGDDSGDDQES